MASAPPPNPPFEWGLLENAVDYLREAVRRLEGEVDRRDLKYAVLHLGAGLELLLKERLRQEDWRQLFKDPEKADEEAYRIGAFKSITTWTAIRRLRELAGVNISEGDRRQVEALRERRNPLEHFRIRDSHEAVSAVASWALGFALDFIAAEIQESDMDEDLRQELEEIRQALPGLREFVAHRLDQVEPELTKARDSATVVECPRCFQPTAVTGDGIKCLFCGFARSLDEVEATASDWIGEILGITEYVAAKEGLTFPIHECPECENRTLVDRGYLDGSTSSERWVCFACGNGWTNRNMSECAHCGEPFDEEWGVGTVCRDCFARAVTD